MPSSPSSKIPDWLKTLVYPAVLLIAGSYLLSWNEESAVAKSRTLRQVAEGLVTISADQVHEVNNGKFVHMTGRLHTTETLKDPQFGVSGELVKLQRDVEMYQWIETVIEKKHATPDGGSEVRKEFSYARKWSAKAIDSSRFDQAAQYPNPGEIPYPTWSGETKAARVGAFRLTESLLADYNEFSPIAVSESDLDKVDPALRNQVRVHDGKFHFGKDPSNPQIGDVRVLFRGAKGGTVSVFGKQSGAELGPFDTALGQSFQGLEPGERTATLMFRQQAPAPANTWYFWLIRGIGFAALASAWWIWMPLIAPVGTRVPFLHLALGGSWRINAFVAAGILWLLIVGSAWLNDRAYVSLSAWLAAVVLPLSCVLTRMNSSAKIAARR